VYWRSAFTADATAGIIAVLTLYWLLQYPITPLPFAKPLLHTHFIQSGDTTAHFKATGKQLIEAGWLKAYSDSDETYNPDSSSTNTNDSSDDSSTNDDAMLPNLSEGMPLDCAALQQQERHTKPPNRY
jgi:DNA topoisomerase IA